MKKTFFLSTLVVAMAVMFSSCAVNLNGVTARYNPMNNYFVNNNFQNGTHKLVIHNQRDFESVFGMAAVMGRNGQPTNIDFNRQFVIAIILPETDYQTGVETVMLNRDGNRLYYSYMIHRGHRTSYNIRPFAAVVVDRSEPSDVIFQEVTVSDLEKAGIRYNGNYNYNNPTNTTGGTARPPIP